jgi:hypothetical protein
MRLYLTTKYVGTTISQLKMATNLQPRSMRIEVRHNLYARGNPAIQN